MSMRVLRVAMAWPVSWHYFRHDALYNKSVSEGYKHLNSANFHQLRFAERKEPSSQLTSPTSLHPVRGAVEVGG